MAKRSEDSGRALRAHAQAIWQAGIDAVAPGPLVADTIRVTRKNLCVGALELPRRAIASVTIVGAGKAATGMARAVEAALAEGLGPDFPIQGWVNAPDPADPPLTHVHVQAARHGPENVPARAAVDGTRRVLEVVGDLNTRDLVVTLISGGASSLLVAPSEGLTVGDKAQITRLLGARGATIEELNAVRKHLSDVKGGGLARRLKRGWMSGLILSDVVGDPLDVIGSGPTAADETTFADTLSVLDAFDLLDDPLTPPRVLRHLEAGAAGGRRETLRALPHTVANQIVGANRLALDAAEREAKRLGYHVLNLSSWIEGDTDEVARLLAGMVRGIRAEHRPLSAPACLLVGGEVTVKLEGEEGIGGRNQQMALAALVELGLAGLRDVVVLSGGTDGEDGPTDAAGGLVTRDTLARALDLQIDPLDHLERRDAYPFLKATEGLLTTGRTGTNVSDLRVILVGPPPRKS